MYSLLLFFHCCNQPITKPVPKPNTYNIDKYKTITSHGTLRAKSSRISVLCREEIREDFARRVLTWQIHLNYNDPITQRSTATSKNTCGYFVNTWPPPYRPLERLNIATSGL
jgi:hypothetical protein